MAKTFFNIEDESTYDRPPRVITGEWRECTPAERASLGVVVYECVVHAGFEGCECSWQGCLPRMVKLERPAVGMFKVKITDKRRTR